MLDLRRWDDCLQATRGVDHVYALAADMGGMGFISAQPRRRSCTTTPSSTSTRSRRPGSTAVSALPVQLVGLHLSASTSRPTPTSCRCKEEDAYPAEPQDAYGWEKLITERLCEYYAGEYGMETRIVALPQHLRPLRHLRRRPREGAGRACAARSRLAEAGGAIEIWGDGEQTRSFCYIDDCVEGIYRLMQSDYREPLNLGTDRWSRSTSWPASSSRSPASRDISVRHVDGPQGVRGRNSDNTRLREVLGWEPAIELEDGLAETYRWIEKQVHGQPVRRAVPPGSIPRVDVLGVGISAIDMAQAVDEIARGSRRASSTTCASPACTA